MLRLEYSRAHPIRRTLNVEKIYLNLTLDHCDKFFSVKSGIDEDKTGNTDKKIVITFIVIGVIIFSMYPRRFFWLDFTIVNLF